jgi:hypothetical protein
MLGQISQFMTPLSTFIEPLKERAKLLKKEKRDKWVSKNREIVTEQKRRSAAKIRAKSARFL